MNLVDYKHFPSDVSGTRYRPGLNHNFEDIYRKTNKNLNSGVYAMPHGFEAYSK